MSELKRADIISKIKEQAYENVTKKIEEERKLTETKISREIDDVQKCLDMIEQNLVFKKTKNNYGRGGTYELATPELFFADYAKKTEYSWDKGIKFKTGKPYEPYFTVNGEDYYDTRYILQKWDDDWRRFDREVTEIHKKYNELEEERQKLLNEQKNIKKILIEYNELMKANED